MPINFMDIINPVFGGFLVPRPIRHIKDGQRADKATERDLQGLSEHTLRDIGYTSLPG